MEFLVVGMGGFLGSCLRYGITLFYRRFEINLPIGTLISNILAGLLIGFIIGMETQTGRLSPKTKLFLTTGFLGGLSTFSTFSMETVELFSSGKYGLSFLNVLLNLSCSILGVLLGLAAAKLAASVVSH